MKKIMVSRIKKEKKTCSYTENIIHDKHSRLMVSLWGTYSYFINELMKISALVHIV